MIRETTFENAKVGDKVWNLSYRVWGTIKEINTRDYYQLKVEFINGMTNTYTFDGIISPGRHQSIFWDEVKVEAPTRIKRKVKKIWVGWANVYEDQVHCHTSKEKAKNNHGFDPDLLAVAVPVEIEYEEEE